MQQSPEPAPSSPAPCTTTITSPFLASPASRTPHAGGTWGPAERDLMFIPAAHRAAFERGYGPFPNHPAVLEYVAADYLLQELLDCAERLLFRPNTNAAEQQWALELARIRLRQMRDLLPTLSHAHSIDGSPQP